jgi:hypothetical protein
MLTISFAPWVVLGRACAEKKLRHYVTAAMRLTAIIKSSPHITGTCTLPLPNHQSASQAQPPPQPTRPHSNHIIMSNRALPVIGLAAAGGVGYYLYNAGGDPKLAEKKMERMSLMQRE